MTERDEVLLHEEQLVPGLETTEAGSVHAGKRVEHETVTTQVERGTEHSDVHRAVVDLEAGEDDGEVHVLPDGSISIPVFEEQIVVTKKLVVRERVVVHKHTVYENHVVTADLRREHLDVTADDAIADRVNTGTGGTP